MKNKLLQLFIAFVRKAFSEERLLELISGLLDILYDGFDPIKEGSEKDV